MFHSISACRRLFARRCDHSCTNRLYVWSDVKLVPPHREPESKLSFSLRLFCCEMQIRTGAGFLRTIGQSSFLPSALQTMKLREIAPASHVCLRVRTLREKKCYRCHIEKQFASWHYFPRARGHKGQVYLPALTKAVMTQSHQIPGCDDSVSAFSYRHGLQHVASSCLHPQPRDSYLMD